MTEQEIKNKSLFDVFASQQETFEEAQKKNSEESRKRATYLRFNQDGTYSIRILPLAPVIDADGNALPMDRKGYEYPLRSLMLKIEDNTKLDKKGKPKLQYVTVCNAKQAFKDLKEDLIDTYVRVASDKYASDEELIKKLRAGSFEGGLKWDSHRCMYVYDTEKRGNGIQILQLSFAQYRELEERKLGVWNKLLKKNAKAGCPISSIKDAYPVEITRKTEAKTSYSFNIDTLSDVDSLTEDELQSLIDMPRLPETIYRYSRYHLEATIAYLRQLDEKFDIDVVDSEEVKEAVDTIKMLLPADDTSHFTLGGKDKDGEDGASATDSLDDLWNRWDDIDAQGLDDKSDEGAELRADIKEFIEENGLEVKILRNKTNQQILEEIEKALGGRDEEEDEEEEQKPEPKKSARKRDVEEDDDDTADDGESEEAPESNDDEEEEEEETRAPRRRERNDDTNEPAARSDRRAGRPQRRR